MRKIYDVPHTIVRPQESDELLLNPGKGVATFQRFNGDPPAYDCVWIDDGPTEFAPSPASTQNKDYPQCTLAYFRWSWKTIEPKKGERRWDVIDYVLEEGKRRGQDIQLRIMPVDGVIWEPTQSSFSGCVGKKNRIGAGVPDWYAKIARTRETLAPGHLEPFYDDDSYLRHWGDLIRDLGARYDGHPDLDAVDVSILGAWGEGGGEDGGQEYQEATDKLIDVYIESFRKTPLVSLINGYQFKSGVRKGLGWRADCFGDTHMYTDGDPEKGPCWNHMYNYYPMCVATAAAQDAWKTRPVLMESCWVPMKWYENKFPIDWIIRQGLKYHMSVLMPKSAPVPAEWEDKFNDFIKRMGYRFVLRQVMSPKRTRPGGLLWYYIWIENVGVAPIYREYRLAFRLRQGEASEILLSPTDIRTWMPGDVWLDEKLPLPPSIKSGKVDIDIGIIDPKTSQPAVKFANRGNEPDGWHKVLSIDVTGAM